MAGPLAVVGVLAGCGTYASSSSGTPSIDGGTLGRGMEQTLERDSGTAIGEVRCPAQIPIVVGRKFTCAVQFASEERSIIDAEVTSAGGQVTYRLRWLVQSSIARQIEAQLVAAGKALRVRCPPRISGNPGSVGFCEARDSRGHVRKLKLTVLDNGRVNWDYAGVAPPIAH